VSTKTNNTGGKPPAYVPAILAFTAGLGLTVMAVSLALGAIQGSAANSGAIGLGFAAGLAAFILGFVGWIGIVQPHKHFDDINVPQDTGGHHESAHHE
jgi:hypothetical protein